MKGQNYDEARLLVKTGAPDLLGDRVNELVVEVVNHLHLADGLLGVDEDVLCPRCSSRGSPLLFPLGRYASCSAHPRTFSLVFRTLFTSLRVGTPLVRRTPEC